jgi:hypothetical protein
MTPGQLHPGGGGREGRGEGDRAAPFRGDHLVVRVSRSPDSIRPARPGQIFKVVPGGPGPPCPHAACPSATNRPGSASPSQPTMAVRRGSAAQNHAGFCRPPSMRRLVIPPVLLASLSGKNHVAANQGRMVLIAIAERVLHDRDGREIVRSPHVVRSS